MALANKEMNSDHISTALTLKSALRLTEGTPTMFSTFQEWPTASAV